MEPVYFSFAEHTRACSIQRVYSVELSDRIQPGRQLLHARSGESSIKSLELYLSEQRTSPQSGGRRPNDNLLLPLVFFFWPGREGKIVVIRRNWSRFPG